MPDSGGGGQQLKFETETCAVEYSSRGYFQLASATADWDIN